MRVAQQIPSKIISCRTVPRKVRGTKDETTMNHTKRFWVVVVALPVLAAIQARSQNSAPTNGTQISPQTTTTTSEPSLGSYARGLKKDKKEQSAKTFDNDNLPREDKLSVVGPAAESTDSANAASVQQAAPADANSSDKGKSTPPPVTPGESPEQRQQVYDQWKEKISSQQSEVDLLSRELDVQQREYKLRSAEFYGDAGERLRNQAGWDKEDSQFKQKLAEKQKALDDAKEKLGDLQEDARKAGVPSSARGEDQQPEQ
ncbi:MAG: hypothetical protein JOZ80_15310 [Acidobacteriaceae bacterium]|nr:hypothetical protein [Acidobacteriaceae bacterium]